MRDDLELLDFFFFLEEAECGSLPYLVLLIVWSLSVGVVGMQGLRYERFQLKSSIICIKKTTASSPQSVGLKRRPPQPRKIGKGVFRRLGRSERRHHFVIEACAGQRDKPFDGHDALTGVIDDDVTNLDQKIDETIERIVPLTIAFAFEAIEADAVLRACGEEGVARRNKSGSEMIIRARSSGVVVFRESALLDNERLRFGLGLFFGSREFQLRPAFKRTLIVTELCHR